jgi:hypothetical protein
MWGELANIIEEGREIFDGIYGIGGTEFTEFFREGFARRTRSSGENAGVGIF